MSQCHIVWSSPLELFCLAVILVMLSHICCASNTEFVTRQVILWGHARKDKVMPEARLLCSASLVGICVT